jgi:hypothetical protein
MNDLPPPKQSRKYHYKGKPPSTKHSSDGLAVLVVVPTLLDVKWRFADAPARDESECLDMIQYPSDVRTVEQRFKDSISCGKYKDDWQYDSEEIGVQCFTDGRWPEKTDLKCWWCLHQFDTKPFPCPVHMNYDGKMRIRGVFCGPSCAKAWVVSSNFFSNYSHVFEMIDTLARSSGFKNPKDNSICITTAPPRESLNVFCGSEGLTIEQFRGLCACGFRVSVLHPPFITEKQVIVAECEQMARAVKYGRIGHIDTPDGFMISAAEYARKKRNEGMEIFAGIGSKRLTDYVEKMKKTQITTQPPPLPQQPFNIDTTILPTPPPKISSIGRNGKIKRPLPIIEPMAKSPGKKRRRIS